MISIKFIILLLIDKHILNFNIILIGFHCQGQLHFFRQ